MKTRGQRPIMYPPVKGYGDFEVEPFESYSARWPVALSGIPRAIVEDWIYRHWHDFRNHWMQMQPHRWEFARASFSSFEILSIGHIGTWIPELDAEGVEYVTGAPRSRTRLAQFMLANGTFPVPIIVARDAGRIIHPRSGGESMKEPYQLIEGHCRLACLRGMINSRHPNLSARHEVWVATIPNDS